MSKPFPLVAPGAEPGAVTGGAVPIEVQFQGVGDLHQRYFGDGEIVTQLSAALGDCFNDRAVVRISYDSEARIGRIRAFADPKSLKCKPSKSGGGVDLAPLEVLGKALAAYRDTIAGQFDFRVASFRIDLEALNGTNLCRLELAGQFPPDGTTWSPCMSLGGERACAGKPSEGVRRIDFPTKAHNDYLASCFAY